MATSEELIVLFNKQTEKDFEDWERNGITSILLLCLQENHPKYCGKEIVQTILACFQRFLDWAKSSLNEQQLVNRFHRNTQEFEKWGDVVCKALKDKQDIIDKYPDSHQDIFVLNNYSLSIIRQHFSP